MEGPWGEAIISTLIADRKRLGASHTPDDGSDATQDMGQSWHGAFVGALSARSPERGGLAEPLKSRGGTSTGGILHPWSPAVDVPSPGVIWIIGASMRLCHDRRWGPYGRNCTCAPARACRQCEARAIIWGLIWPRQPNGSRCHGSSRGAGEGCLGGLLSWPSRPVRMRRGYAKPGNSVWGLRIAYFGHGSIRDPVSGGYAPVSTYGPALLYYSLNRGTSSSRSLKHRCLA